jgi:long-chain acyl-CoA synthetase
MGEAVERFRGSLAALGIGKGDPIGIALPNSPHFVIAHFAVLGLGAISVPINILNKAREISAQIEDIEARAVICWSNLSPEIEKGLAGSESVRHRIYLGDQLPEGVHSLVDMMQQGERLRADNSLSPDDLASVMYSSGVSGHPRGVELTHRNFSEQAHEVGRLLRIRESDRFLGALPFTSIMGLTMSVHMALYHGAELVVVPRFHPGDTLKSLQNDQITVFVGNPSMYSLMSRFPSAEKYDLNKLRYLVSTESKLPETVARDVEEKLKLRVFEGYGSNETCGMVTINLFPGLVTGGTVGQPIGGLEARILDEHGQSSQVGSIGQVALRGPTIARGYYNRPEKTKQAIKDGWLLTGDLGYQDYESNLYITGHTNDVIVKGGFAVYPREVEEVVEGLPHVQEVAAIGIPDPVYGEEIKLCIVLKEGANIGPSEIIEYVKERLAIYKCPKLIKFYKELPHSATGKILRSELRDEKT